LLAAEKGPAIDAAVEAYLSDRLAAEASESLALARTI